MTVVQATLQYPGGAPWKNATCTVGQVGPGFVPGQPGVIVGATLHVQSGPTGIVSFDVPHLANGWYIFTPPHGGGQQIPFNPPTTGGPYWITDVAAPIPGMGLLGASLADLANVARPLAVGTTPPASPSVNDLWVDTN